MPHGGGERGDRERDRRSLKELAKMAQGLTPAPSSRVIETPGERGDASGRGDAPYHAKDRKDDSGIVDLAAAAKADPYGAIRAQTTPLASHSLFEEEPASRRPRTTQRIAQVRQPAPSVPPSAEAQAPASMPPSGHAHARSSTPARAPVKEKVKEKKSSGAVVAIVLSGIVALSSAAAGGFFYMKSRRLAAIAMAPARQEPAPPPASAPPPSPAPDPAPSAARTEVDPSSLPAAPPARVAVLSKSGKSGGKARPTTEARGDGPAKLAEKDAPEAPRGAAGPLDDAMKKEVGEEGRQKPAAAVSGGNTTTGSVPQKPSQGAVTGALGSVLSEARRCLGPDDPISRASIVFGSDGTVQSVTVTGAASGKPAEACIRGALGKAKVQPFAEPTYTANITIRHN